MPAHLPKLSTGRIVLIITALIAVYFLVTGGFNAIRAHQLNQEESRLQADISDMQDRSKRLQALKQYVNSDEYIEAVARQQLGLVRKGETGWVAISTQASPTPAPNGTQPALWWDVLIR